ncbi:hypothetical protein IKA92_07370 [bacterium]|nr:hypothetical protein [bacterium]MBR2387096.1 hypothetical protein [bacterium]
MNALVTTTNAICQCKAEEVAPQIMTVCRAVTPQFYKGMSDIDIKAEKASIELLTSNIDQQCLAEMCRLAILNYARARSDNDKTYFDINYILTFYKKAFNKLYCESVDIPKRSQLLKSNYDNDTNILEEHWRTPDGQEVLIREIRDENKSGRTYSSKYWQTQYFDFDDAII